MKKLIAVLLMLLSVNAYADRSGDVFTAAIGGLIGGALGYWGGSKLGSAVGGGLTKMAQSSDGSMPEVDPMGNPIGMASEANENLKADASKAAKTTIVNAPTTINNGGGDKKVSVDSIMSPIRNQESSVNKYISSRYA